MKRKILSGFLIPAMFVNIFANDAKMKAQKDEALTIESINLINEQETYSEEDDFTAIRKKMYGGDQKQFSYFSRWHAYLEEVAEEKARKAEYDRKLAEYESTVDRINKENEKIREYNENLANGSSIDVSTLNQENIEDSKKD